MELGEKIKALRIERGLTQEQLAAKLYVSRTAVSKWETGGGTPNLDSLQALARLFEVSVDDLLSAGDLIVLARDERRFSARSDGMLSFGLVDLLAAAFAFLPLYGVDDGGFVRMANLADYGASVGFGVPFAVMAAAVAALALAGMVEVALAAAGPRRAPRAVRVRAHVRALPREGRRRLSDPAFVAPGGAVATRTASRMRRTVACRRASANRFMDARRGPRRASRTPETKGILWRQPLWRCG